MARCGGLPSAMHGVLALRECTAVCPLGLLDVFTTLPADCPQRQDWRITGLCGGVRSCGSPFWYLPG
jgi:hypothetical protein